MRFTSIGTESKRCAQLVRVFGRCLFEPHTWCIAYCVHWAYSQICKRR